jgi:hypothetical protein
VAQLGLLERQLGLLVKHLGLLVAQLGLLVTQLGLLVTPLGLLVTELGFVEFVGWGTAYRGNWGKGSGVDWIDLAQGREDLGAVANKVVGMY